MYTDWECTETDRVQAGGLVNMESGTASSLGTPDNGARDAAIGKETSVGAKAVEGMHTEAAGAPFVTKHWTQAGAEANDAQTECAIAAADQIAAPDSTTESALLQKNAEQLIVPDDGKISPFEVFSASDENSFESAENSIEMQQATDGAEGERSQHDTSNDDVDEQQMIDLANANSADEGADGQANAVSSSNEVVPVAISANLLRKAPPAKRVVKLTAKAAANKLPKKVAVQAVEVAAQRTSGRKRIIPKDYPVNLLGKQSIKKTPAAAVSAPSTPLKQSKAKPQSATVKVTAAPPSKSVKLPVKPAVKRKDNETNSKVPEKAALVKKAVPKPAAVQPAVAEREMRRNRKPTMKISESYDPNTKRLFKDSTTVTVVGTKRAAAPKRVIPSSDSEDESDDNDFVETPAKRLKLLQQKSLKVVPEQSSVKAKIKPKKAESAAVVSSTSERARRQIKPTLKIQETYEDSFKTFVGNRNGKKASESTAATKSGASSSARQLTLQEMKLEVLLKTFEEHKSTLDGIFSSLKNQSNVVDYKGVDHILIMDVITRDNEQVLVRRLRQEYEKNSHGSSLYTHLYFNALLPEWIIKLLIKKYKLKREDVIKQLRAQQE